MAETIKGMNIKLGLDTTALDAKLRGLTSELKEQEKDLRSINARLRYDPTNADLWKQKQDILNRSLETTRQRLEAQKQKLGEAREALKVGAIGEGEFKRIERSVQYAEADVSKFNKEIEATGQKLQSLSKADWGRLSSLGSTLTKSLTAPIAGAVTALGTLSYKSLQAADELGDAASKVGLSVEAYQEYSYAAEMLAVDQNTLFKAFTKVNGILGDIAGGNASKVDEKLKLIGMTSKDLEGLSTEQAFEKIRDAMSVLGDEADRTAVANEVFGDKLGTELAQVLSATSSQIEGLKNEARELGIVSDEDAELAGDFTDEISRLKQSLKSLSNEVAMAVLPVLGKIVEALKDGIIPKVRAVIGWWDNLSSSAKKVIAAVVGIAAAIGPMTTVVAKAVPAVMKVAQAFKAVQGAVQIAGVAVKASTLGWAALIAVIAAVLLQNESFRNLLKELVGMLQGVISKIVGFIGEILEKLKPVLEAVVGLINRVIDVVVGLIEELMDPLRSVIDLVIGLLGELIPIIVRLVDNVMPVLIQIIDVVIQLIGPLGEVLRVVIQLVNQIISAVTGLISSVLDVLIGVIGQLADVIGVVMRIVGKVIEVVVAILQPVLKVVVQLLQPIFRVIGVIVDAISRLFDILSPLLQIFLLPLTMKLQLISALLEALEPLIEAIGNVLETVIGPILDAIFQLLKPILDVINWIIDGIKWLIDNIAAFFGGARDEAEKFSSGFQSTMGGAVDWVTGRFGSFFEGIKDGLAQFAEWMEGLASGIAAFFAGVFDKLGGWISDAADAVGSWATDTWSGITGWFEDAGEAIGGWFGDVGDWFSDTFNLGGGPGSVSNQTSNTVNNVTINTTSSEFDIDSVNNALGGAYL